MSTPIAGADVLLSIDGVVVGGQRDTGFTASTDEIDASYKGSGNIKAVLPGLSGYSMPLTIAYMPGDAGMKALVSAALNRTPVTALYTLHADPTHAADADDLSFTAAASVLNMNVQAPHNGPCTISFDLKLTEEPVVEGLSST